MARIVAGVSRTFNEYLLLPNRTGVGCSPEAVDLRTPLVRYREGGESAIALGSPFTSAIMQAVGSPGLAIALARNGGLSFLHHNRSIDEQAAGVRKVKNFKAGFVTSDTNVLPQDTPKTDRMTAIADHEDNRRYPNQLVDPDKRLRVGAGSEHPRLRGAHSRAPGRRRRRLVHRLLRRLLRVAGTGHHLGEEALPEVPVGGGNVVDAEAFNYLAEAGADFVKVGIGGGSICITREQKGIGRGQASAVIEVAEARDDTSANDRRCTCRSARTAASVQRLSHRPGARDGRRLRDDGPLLRPLRRGHRAARSASRTSS